VKISAFIAPRLIMPAAPGARYWRNGCHRGSTIAPIEKTMNLQITAVIDLIDRRRFAKKLAHQPGAIHQFRFHE
jgi:hypothetical protein